MVGTNCAKLIDIMYQSTPEKLLYYFFVFSAVLGNLQDAYVQEKVGKMRNSSRYCTNGRQSGIIERAIFKIVTLTFNLTIYEHIVTSSHQMTIKRKQTCPQRLLATAKIAGIDDNEVLLIKLTGDKTFCFWFL